MSTELTSEGLTGKVAAILGPDDIAINRGTDHCVQIGMHFKVLLKEAPVEIRDPDTYELLGVVDTEKFRMKVIAIGPLMAVCRTLTTNGAYTYRAVIGDRVQQVDD